VKDFDRWFRTDDTPQWKRASFRFLLVATGVVLLALLVWRLLGG
jgi:hypothetical protein